MKTKTTEMCFAYIIPEMRSYSNESCKALTCGCLGNDACPFYKGISKYMTGLAAANARLRSLPAEKQYRIADIYYNGEMPWRYENEMH